MRQGEVGRVVVALLVAAATPATLFTFFQLLGLALAESLDSKDFEVVGTWLMVFIVAFLHALFFGIPMYFIAKLLHLTRWWVSMAGGFLIGAMPVAISGSPYPNSDYKVWDGKA